MDTSEPIPFGTLPPGTYFRWSWCSQSESWLCGTSRDGAGVFYEDGHNPECPEGYYFSSVSEGYITDIARGPYDTREKAMTAAEERLRELGNQV